MMMMMMKPLQKRKLRSGPC